MSAPRLKTHIRVAAHLRRAEAAGAFALVARRGDADAGAVAVKVYAGPGRARVWFEARDGAGAHVWRDPFDGETDEASVERWLARETDFDPDMWVLEIEDREGRAFLDEGDPSAGGAF